MLIDGRQMQPPEPLERTLAALEDLGEGDELVLLLYCQPRPLLAILRRDGFEWVESLQPDGTCEFRIRRASAR